MIGALLTTVFFSLSVIFANRSIRAVGAVRANLGRLLFAVVVLGAYAHTAGGGMAGAGRDWFLLSGVIGMGLGDLALFVALPLIGSRLSILMTQCLAVPVAMVAERVWLGTTLSAAQVCWAMIVITGVALALMPSRKSPPKVPVRMIGFLWGFFAAVGQGLGAVISRRAYDVATATGESVDGITAAYQRIAGGVVLTVGYFVVRAWLRRERNDTPKVKPTVLAHGWVVLNSLCGAVIGVSCYQWALSTTPAGIVLPIVATTPLVIVPLAWWFERERPTRRSLLGGLVAVAGVVALALAR